jgi:hypothetical protein
MSAAIWSRNFALAKAWPMWRTHTGASDAHRPALPSWRPQHRLTDTRGLRRTVKARSVHGTYGSEMRELRELVRGLRADAKQLAELTQDATATDVTFAARSHYENSDTNSPTLLQHENPLIIDGTRMLPNWLVDATYPSSSLPLPR